VVDTARVEYWKGTGAQVSERVAYIVKNVPNAGAAAAVAGAPAA
jgi:small subunit ribosomal protein S16